MKVSRSQIVPLNFLMTYMIINNDRPEIGEKELLGFPRSKQTFGVGPFVIIVDWLLLLSLRGSWFDS